MPKQICKSKVKLPWVVDHVEATRFCLGQRAMAEEMVARVIHLLLGGRPFHQEKTRA